MGYCCRKNTVWNVVLKLFLGVALFMLVFCMGAASVVRMTRGRMVHNEAGGYMMGAPGQGMMSGNMEMGWSDDRGMTRTMTRMDTIEWKRLFGSITKIEGNKITILNNAAEEQMVMSMQDTIIGLAGNEVGLGALKVGQNVVVVYQAGSEATLQAKTISVQ